MHIKTKCRVCLRGDRRMFAISNSTLQDIWEKMTSARFDSNDGRPVLACYVCCAQLKKSHQLKERALKAEELLTDLINNGFEQSQESISMIANLSYDLKYKLVSEPIMYFEHEPIVQHPVAEIKVEIEEVKEEVSVEDCEEANKHVIIKVEEDDIQHKEYHNMVDGESSTQGDSKEPLKSVMEQVVKKEVQVTFEDTNIDAPRRRRKANVPRKVKQVYTRAKERKSSNNATNRLLPQKNSKTFNENVSGNIHTACNVNVQNVKYYGENDIARQRHLVKAESRHQFTSLHDRTRQNLISVSNPGVSKNITSISKSEPIITVENYNDENKMLEVYCRESENASKESLEKYGSRKEENELDAVDSNRVSEKNFLCNICRSTFVKKEQLYLHLCKHPGEELYICHICDCRFSVKCKLIKHIKSRHTKEKKFLCHICQYKFTRKCTLAIHLRKHTGEKPYVCDLCDYSCIRRCNFVDHVKHKHTMEKNFSCHICEYKCVNKGKLNMHLRTHTGERPYICNMCEFRCQRKDYLQRHIKSKHTKEKNFSCHICQYKSARKDALTIHMRRHTGEKRYACELCDCRFALKSNLNTHVKKHTEIISN